MMKITAGMDKVLVWDAATVAMLGRPSMRLIKRKCDATM